MSSKENRKARTSAPATKPGAVSCAFEEVDVEEPGALATASSTLKKESAKAKRVADEAAKATGRKTVRATVPGVTMMEPEEPSVAAGVEPSSSKKPKVASSSNSRDRKAARGIAATVPGAVSMINEEEAVGSHEPEPIVVSRRISRGPRQEEPDLVDERAPMKQHGKSRGKPATTPGVVRMQENTVTTASYGMEKPARVTTGEIAMPGAVSVIVGEVATSAGADTTGSYAGSARPGAQAMSGGENGGQDAAVRRKDPRANARTKKAGAAAGAAAAVQGGANAYQARMEEKIKSMEEELGAGSSNHKDDHKFDETFLSVKSNEKDSLKGRDDDEPKMGLALLPPQEAPAPYATSADRGVAGAPDLVHGTTHAGYGGAGYGGAGYGGFGHMSDDGLAVAIAVEDEEEELFFPAAIEYDPDSKPPLHKNRRFRVYAIGAFLFFVVIIIGVVIGVVAGGGSGSRTYPPTGTPTSSPTSSQEGMYRQQFAAVVGDAVMTAGTPHDMAANWIIAEDPAKLGSEAPNLIQRYLLALFYFITTNNGSTPWRSCNRPTGDEEEDECQFERITRFDNDSIGYVPETAVRWLSAGHECTWVGSMCDELQISRALEVWGQNITGTLPVEIKELPFLQSISLSYNEFTGTLPAEWVTMKHLLNLEVHGNMLTGTIAEKFWSSNSLQNFNVGENFLSGTISSLIGLLTNLKGLHTFENMLSGSIPSEIGNLVFLAYNRHNNNKFNGTIPTEIGKLSLVQELWLQQNTFSGTIPSEIGFMQDLTDIRLDTNNLTGTIPDELYAFRFLSRFYIFDTPGVTGTISTLIGQLTKLEDLRFRRIGLTGTIPTEIGLLTGLRLGWFHLTQLAGSMPTQVCANVGPGLLEYLQTDCNPVDAPAVSCECCSACCDRQSQSCLILN